MTALQSISRAAILTALMSIAAASPSNREQTSLNGIWDFYPNGGQGR